MLSFNPGSNSRTGERTISESSLEAIISLLVLWVPWAVWDLPVLLKFSLYKLYVPIGGVSLLFLAMWSMWALEIELKTGSLSSKRDIILLKFFIIKLVPAFKPFTIGANVPSKLGTVETDSRLAILCSCIDTYCIFFLSLLFLTKSLLTVCPSNMSFKLSCAAAATCFFYVIVWASMLVRVDLFSWIFLTSSLVLLKDYSRLMRVFKSSIYF